MIQNLKYKMDPLKDPKNNRQAKSVKPPPGRPLSTNLIFDDPKNPSNFMRLAKLENYQGPPQKGRIPPKV